MAAVTTGTLRTVKDYIDDSRTLLQDTILPPRYDDASLLVAFNTALLEGRRLRPDLFVYAYPHGVPHFPTVDANMDVNIEGPFRMAFVFGTCAHALARDQEDVQDARAATFMGVFNDLLIGVRPRPLAPPKGG